MSAKALVHVLQQTLLMPVQQEVTADELVGKVQTALPLLHT